MIRNAHTRILGINSKSLLSAVSARSGFSKAATSQIYSCQQLIRWQSTNTQGPETKDTETSTAASEPLAEPSTLTASNDQVPWYMRNNEDTTQLSSNLKEPLPDLPSNPPDSLQPLVEYLVKDLGLSDVEFIDLRNREPMTVFGPDAMMIVTTGKSDKHIGKAAQGLLTFIKHNFGVTPSQEGIYSAGFIKVQKRRARKKSKKLSMADDSYESLVSRFTSDWVSLDTNVDSLLVHMFTKDKRAETDLTYTWSQNKRELREQRRREREALEGSLDTQGNLGDSQRDNKTHSPFSSIGSVRSFHTCFARRVAAAPLTQPFDTISLKSNDMTPKPLGSGASASNEATKPLEPKDALQEMKVFSFLGNYQKVREVYHATFMKTGENTPINYNLLTSPPSSELDQLGSQALLILLKAHINYISKLKTVSHHSEPSKPDFDQLSFTSKPPSTLKQSSDVVSSFIGSFPYFPTADHWRLRLVFFQRAHMLNPKEFPLQMLIQIPIQQLASGELVDRWTIDFVINTIIHSREFSDLTFMAASRQKSKLALTLASSCIRPFSPSGKVSLDSNAPALDDSLLLLFYRLWINETNNLRQFTVSPAVAKADATPFSVDGTPFNVAAQFSKDHRARVMTPQAMELYHYFSSELDYLNGPARTPTYEDPTVASSFLLLSFTCFVNDGLWNSFWALWKKTIRSALFSPALFYNMLALVSKSGDIKAMTRLIDYEVPNVLLLGDQYLNKDTTEVLSSILSVLDPSENGYPAFRRVLAVAK